MTPWSIARQDPLSMGFLRHKTLETGLKINGSLLFIFTLMYRASQVVLLVKNLFANAGDGDLISAWEDHLEEGKAIHSSTLAWRISWTEEPGGL